jgi:hypothetical protein
MTTPVACAVLLLLPALAQGQADPCRGRGSVLLVDVAAHRLTLCQASSALARFPVALGRGGVGKRVRGDTKTPLGAYPLGAPRASARFGTFIPVGYPTREQRRQGFTGDAIGLHGPPRATRDLGSINVSIDWTLGCIAVADDATIREIAAWVRANPGVEILVE